MNHSHSELRSSLASDLRRALSARGGPRPTSVARHWLMGQLRRFVDAHPCAPLYLYDAGPENARFWNSRPRSARGSRDAALTPAQAALVSRSLIQLQDDVAARTCAIAVAAVTRDWKRAAQEVREGSIAHGTDGAGGQYLLWAALLDQLHGRSAAPRYHQLAGSPIAAIRRGGLASGTFAAASAQRAVDIDRHLAQMLDEDPDHQRVSLKRAVTMRRRRLGALAVRREVQRIRARLEVLHPSAAWLDDTAAALEVGLCFP
ncbi:MAG: hypothetical protein P8M11_07635 [Planctomycetota bacterium]|nr:hypothetical protein [Planctomycetota bacterium]